MNENRLEYPAPLLEGQHNFRDLGGLRTNTGRRIRPELLFRSGDLHSLTDEDIRILEKLKISVVIDFRSPKEREIRPNRSISTVKEIILLPIHDAPRQLASEYVRTNNGSGLEMLLVKEYERIIQNYIPEYQKFLSILATHPDTPVLFQCSAGKDRTGLAAFFLLTAMGIREEDKLRDYYATNHYARAHADEIKEILRRDGHDGELMQPLLDVRPEYLASAFAQIERSYGDLQNFVLKILKADSGRLMSRYLTN
jgi:protein-tyrosine phosphatase